MTDVDRIKSEVAALTRRYEIASLLEDGGIGIELGVAEGFFSKKILELSKLSYLYSVDMYAGDRGHGIGQYKSALRVLDPFKHRNSILKMRFDEAVELFPDNYFDFIYVDGYAHTGEESGDTFFDWYPKLKVGGILAGDDYDEVAWPGVVSSVNQFSSLANIDILVINISADARNENMWSRYPTWLAVKTSNAPVLRPASGLTVPPPPSDWMRANSSRPSILRRSAAKMKRITRNVLTALHDR